jgi:tRNA (cmo5U34)-methyltransferase
MILEVSMNELQQQLRLLVDPEQTTQKDDIYQEIRPYKHFAFDREVVSVFPDMISRSVPGYWISNQGIGIMSKRYAQANSNIYDLGCSLGASTYSILEQQAQNEAQLIAVDGSKEMIEHLEGTLEKQFPMHSVQLHCGDIRTFPLHNASVVILHYTLQFIPQEDRNNVLKRIYDALLPNGVLLLSEKIRFSDEELEQNIRRWHHDYKAAEGYSPLEIEQKARDIRTSMKTDTLDSLQKRLSDTGFTKVTLWMRCYGFSSFVVQK